MCRKSSRRRISQRCGRMTRALFPPGERRCAASSPRCSYQGKLPVDGVGAVRGASMPMAMMQIGHVRVVMDERFVPVRMTVRLPGRIVGLMGVAMVLIVHVRVLVHHLFVPMFVTVALA